MRAMIATSLTLFGLVYFTSAFTVHQHGAKEHCIDLQCPATAIDYGVKHLVDEESMNSEQCTSCDQCTSNGYSLCMRVNTVSRASRNSAGFCSCSHSVPANCHNQLAKDRHPVNITMQMYRMCYSSAVQAPPRPLAVNEKASVIITVESFWDEPYWRELELDNLKLHYEYSVENPDHCDGHVLTTEGFNTEHICVNAVNISMNGDLGGEGEEYEDPNEYDSDLPPEVQIDREVFAGAKLLKTFYTVNVRRPRQLEENGGSDPFRDITTEVESEVLKFDLKPEVFGESGHVPSAEELPKPKEDNKEEPHPTSVEAEEDGEDVSEERGGTDFFDETKKNPIEKTIEEEEKEDTKSDELEEKEEEALEKAIEEEAKDDDPKEKEQTETEKEEEEKKEHEEKEKTETEEKSEEVTEKESEDEDKEEKTDDENKDVEEEDKKDEDTETDNKLDDDAETDEEKKESGEDKDQTDDNKGEEGEETTTDANEGSQEAEGKDNEDDEDEKDSEEATWMADQFGGKNLIRTVFAATILSCLLLIVCVCCQRRKLCCFASSETKTGVNGHRYSNPNKNELVCSQPEKERLHQ